MEYKDFDPKNEKDIQYLHGLVDGWVAQNATDATMVYKLQDIYESSSWLFVFAALEKKLYL
jgi:hypothetical protein